MKLESVLFIFAIEVSQIVVVSGYCFGSGGPGFNGPPTVQQIDMTSVRVSWAGRATRVECADQFLVKSWDYDNPNLYQISDLLSTTTFNVVVKDLKPGYEYVFQAVAREDKGILGKKWNKSPTVRYATKRDAPTVPPDPTVPSLNLPSIKISQDGEAEFVFADEPSPGSLGPTPEVDGHDAPYSLFVIIFISCGIVVVIILVTGGIYNICKLTRRKRRSRQNSDSSNDSIGLHITSENMVSWRQSRRDLIEESRKASTVSSVTDLRRLPDYSSASVKQLSQPRTPSREKRQVSQGSLRDARSSRRDRSSRRTLNRSSSRHSKRDGRSCSKDYKREDDTSFSEGSVKDNNKSCRRKGPNCSRSMRESMDNRRNFGTQTILCDCSALSTPAVERRRQFAENSGKCATEDGSCGNCALQDKFETIQMIDAEEAIDIEQEKENLTDGEEGYISMKSPVSPTDIVGDKSETIVST